MQEFEQKILEQYDIEVSSTRKVRGAVLCETNKRWKLCVQESHWSVQNASSVTTT